MRRVAAERSPVKVLVLCILTLGIYYIYWLYVTSQDIDDYLGETDLPPIVHLLLFLCTGTLWGFAWDVLTAQKIAKMQARAGLPVQNDTLLYLVLDILGAGPVAGVGIVVPLIQQTRLNEIYRTGNPGSNFGSRW